MNHNFIPGTPGVYDASLLQPFVNSLPTEEDQYHSMVVLLNLQNLNGFVNDYASAIGLHLHVQQLRESVLRETQPGTLDFNNHMHLLKNWDEMAGREAAMTIYHVGKALIQIKANLRFTGTIKTDADSTVLRKATGNLARAFPNYDVARHAAGHRAETMASLDEMKRHAIDIEGGQKLIMGNIDGDDYIATFEKKLIKVPLTQQARQRLNSVVALIYSGFPKLVHMLPRLNFGVQAPDNGESPPMT
ncbi:hypothetical protein [Agrobacterium pusense]|uniref:hypothetical protein n=1 Tax=Agrobacterium pusense TaxID=648995 RepID=UPI0021D215C8|nr:hypothetical protein [Agrobacterium pusense]UXT89297.1 hypothetical protein FY130_05875 [Agrobacterium pusense]